MYSNSQWPGHGQPESADMFREIAEVMPQIPGIPVRKIVRGVKSLVTGLHSAAEESHDQQAAVRQEPQSI